MSDNARAPYGNKPFEIVYRYTLDAIKKLFESECELVLIACNTASAKALRTIQQNYLPQFAPKKRVLGIIIPTSEEVGKITKSKHVGILATKGTVISGSYPIEINKLYPDIKVFQQACPMLVPLIESNEYDNLGADFFVKKYVNCLLNQSSRIDTIILGCTHYPIIINKIKEYVPNYIKIISQGAIVANSFDDYLKRHSEIEQKLSKNSTVKYFTSETKESFDTLASLFCNKKIEANTISFY